MLLGGGLLRLLNGAIAFFRQGLVTLRLLLGEHEHGLRLIQLG
jgi:hypothetical protein